MPDTVDRVKRYRDEWNARNNVHAARVTSAIALDDEGAGRAMSPRQVVHAVLHRAPHHFVPGGVVRDLVDAVPEAVVRSQFGFVAIGLASEFAERGGSDQLAECLEPLARKPRTLARDALA